MQILRLPGTTLLSVQHDLLHIVDKGTASHILANELFLLVQDSGVDGNVAQRTEHLWWLISMEYDTLEVPLSSRIPALHFKMFCDSEAKNPTVYPEMSQVKAAHMKHLARAVLAVSQNQFAQPNNLYEHRRRILQHLCSFYDLIAAADIVPSAEEGQQIYMVVHKCVLHYTFLAEYWAKRGRLLFSVVPKFHFWIHLAENAKYANPRSSSCYSNEDYVGRVARVAAAVVKGRAATRVGQGVARNLRTALEVRFHRRSA